MTLEEAKVILATYQMPLSFSQIATYKQALLVVAGAAFKVPTEI